MFSISSFLLFLSFHCVTSGRVLQLMGTPILSLRQTVASSPNHFQAGYPTGMLLLLMRWSFRTSSRNSRVIHWRHSDPVDPETLIHWAVTLQVGDSALLLFPLSKHFFLLFITSFINTGLGCISNIFVLLFRWQLCVLNSFHWFADFQLQRRLNNKESNQQVRAGFVDSDALCLIMNFKQLISVSIMSCWEVRLVWPSVAAHSVAGLTLLLNLPISLYNPLYNNNKLLYR